MQMLNPELRGLTLPRLGAMGRTRRNMTPNSTNVGAAVGVLSGAGLLPTGWTISGIAATGREVVSLAEKNGRPNLKLRLFGTPTATIFITFAPPADPGISAANTQAWVSSLWLQMTAGAATNLTTMQLGLYEYNGAAQLAGTLGSDLAGTISSDLRRQTPYTCVNAATNRVVSYVRLGWVAGAIDITLDFSGVQIERGAVATDFQRWI